MTPDVFRRMLERATRDGFTATDVWTERWKAAAIGGALPAGLLFEAVFPIATTYQGGESELAAELLVEVQPQCPITCEEALRVISSAQRWNLSDRLVPFYLVTAFGASHVLQAVAAVGAESGTDRTLVFGIAYWVRQPAVELIAGYASTRHSRLIAAVEHSVVVEEQCPNGFRVLERWGLSGKLLTTTLSSHSSVDAAFDEIDVRVSQALQHDVGDAHSELVVVDAENRTVRRPGSG